MKRANFLPSFYRLIVRMHPGSFRRRFGDEMVWIFEEERQRGAAARLFFDGVLSLVRQRLRVENSAEPVAVGFSLLNTGEGIAPRRFVEAGVAASLLLAGFMLLLGKTGKPLMVPACLPGMPRATPRVLEVPSGVQGLPMVLPDDHSQRRSVRLDSGQVNNSAASAVRIARAQSSLAAGSCVQK
jgi:hypothetical protein